MRLVHALHSLGEAESVEKHHKGNKNDAALELYHKIQRNKQRVGALMETCQSDRGYNNSCFTYLFIYVYT